MENDQKPALIPHKNCPLNHPLFSSLSACTFRIMILHQQPLRTIYDTLLLTNSTPLTAITFLWCTSNHVPNWWFYFLFNRKNYNPLLLLCPPLSHLTSRTPTKSNLYLTNSLAVSQPPLGWIKVCCYAEVTGISQEDKQLFLPSVAAYSWCLCVACHTHTPTVLWLSADDWLLCGSEGQGVRALQVSLVGSGDTVCYSLFWTPLREVTFGLVGQPVGGDRCPDFPMGLRWCQAYVKEVKLVWTLGDFKFQFHSCILE